MTEYIRRTYAAVMAQQGPTNDNKDGATTKQSRSPSPTTTTTDSKVIPEDTIRDEDKCWKCQGHGRKRSPGGKTTQKNLALTDKICPVCHGNGERQASQRSLELAKQPGKVIQLRGRNGHIVGPRAVQGYRLRIRNLPTRLSIKVKFWPHWVVEIGDSFNWPMGIN